MTTVAITGVAGHVGRRLLHALDLRSDIDRIVGVDVVAPRRSGSPKMGFRELDVRDPGLATSLRGVDVLVHLAARVPGPHDAEETRSVNVDGARNVVEAARAAGVRRLVYVSSVFAYGAHPDNDLPLTERSPLRGTPGLAPSEHARDVERWLATSTVRVAASTSAAPAAGDGATPAAGDGTAPAAGDGTHLQVTVLRFAMVVGGGIDNVLTRLLESPRLVTVRGHRPPLQFLHIDDAVGAIVHAIDRDLVGTYNVCAEGWLSFDEVTAIASKGTVDVPEELAYSAAERLWKLGIGEHPPGIVNHLMHPWVMSPDAFIATGWSPRATNRDALAETVQEHAAYVALAGARAPRSALARTAAWGVAAAVTLLVLRRVARRRSASATAD